MCNFFLIDAQELKYFIYLTNIIILHWRKMQRENEKFKNFIDLVFWKSLFWHRRGHSRWWKLRVFSSYSAIERGAGRHLSTYFYFESVSTFRLHSLPKKDMTSVFGL